MVKYNPHKPGLGYASDFPDRLLVPIVNIDYLKDFVTLALKLKADPGQIFPFDIESIEE